MRIKRLAPVLVVVVLLGTAGLGNGVVQAANLCVDPAGAGGCFTSIQAAVDAADDGDRISIRAGRYVEQVTIIRKDLTLVGQPGAVIQAPADMEQTLLPECGCESRSIVAVAGAEVTLRDLTIDGANSAEDNEFLEGISFVNAGGVIRNNLVKDVGFGEPTLPIVDGEPIYQGDPIVVVNLEATHRTVTIADNRVVNYNNNGITAVAVADPNDPAVANLTVHVLDNTVIGLGANDVIDQYGIFLLGFNFADPQFNITGTVKGNRVRDVVTLASFPLPGIGIVVFDTYNVEVAENVVDNANVGVDATLAFNARIVRNQIGGPRQAAGSAGLLLSGSDTRVAKNRFKNLESGIVLLVEDPDLGSALNTVLNDNRFQDVDADVVTGPGASGVATTSVARIRSKWER
jgi:hypothetical protein